MLLVDGIPQLSRDIFLRSIEPGPLANLFVRLCVAFEYWLWYGFAIAEFAGIAIIRTLGGRACYWESLTSFLCNWPVVSGDDYLFKEGIPLAWRTLGYPWVLEIIGRYPSIFGLRNKLSSDVWAGGGLCSEATYLRRSGSISPLPTVITPDPAGWRWCWLQYCTA